jgi:exodeoxyribonuclease VII large subunit
MAGGFWATARAMTDETLYKTPDAELAGNAHEFTVSELAFRLKREIEANFGQVRVRGEISGLKRHTSGHVYLKLKDADAVLEGVVWRGVAGRLGLTPEDGMEVVATGKLTTYPGRSQYQIVIERIELAGIGAALAMLEARKKKLEAEGLFDPAKKLPLPYLPEIIGVITSPTGAVIRDILHRLAERFPRRVLVWPVPVQGEGAAEKIAAAIAGFNRLPAGGKIPPGSIPRPDLLIVARGGGALEDLMAFNEEIVVRAAAASAIPLIAAVGHETDVTLIDFAASKRAPTPTAAAEMAVPVRRELLADVATLAARLTRAWQRFLQIRREGLRAGSQGLRSPREILGFAMQRLDDRAERLPRALKAEFTARRQKLAKLQAALRPASLRREIAQWRTRFSQTSEALRRERSRSLADWRRQIAHSGQLLESLSYRGALARGFAVVRAGDNADGGLAGGHPIVRAELTSPGQRVEIEWQDGKREAQMAGGSRKSGDTGGGASRGSSRRGGPQGDLF